MARRGLRFTLLLALWMTPATQNGVASPLEKAEEFLDAIESADNGWSQHEILDLVARHQRDVKAHLQEPSRDAEGWVILSRLAWLDAMVHLGSVGDLAEAQKHFAPVREALQEAKSREPLRAEIYYWSSRLWDTEIPVRQGGRWIKRFLDLNAATRDARRAFELESSSVHLENLALVLVQAGSFDEALAVMRQNAPEHAWHYLLSDFAEIPIPARSRALVDDARQFAEELWLRGRFSDHAPVRVRVYWVPLAAGEIESFFQKYWPDFHLMSLADEESQSADTVDTWVQMFLLGGGPPRPVIDTKQLRVKSMDGVKLTIVEQSPRLHPTMTSAGVQLPASPETRSCYLYLVNDRSIH